MFQGLEHLVRTGREDGGAAAAGDVAECVREKRFADADGADDRHVRVRIEEAQGGEFVEERPIERDLRGGIPRLECMVGSRRAFSTRRVTASVSRRATSSLRTCSSRSWCGSFCWRASVRRSGSVSSMRESFRRRRDGFQIGVEDIGGGHWDSSPSEACRAGAAARTGSRAGDSAAAAWCGRVVGPAPP